MCMSDMTLHLLLQKKSSLKLPRDFAEDADEDAQVLGVLYGVQD